MSTKAFILMAESLLNDSDLKGLNRYLILTIASLIDENKKLRKLIEESYNP